MSLLPRKPLQHTRLISLVLYALAVLIPPISSPRLYAQADAGLTGTVTDNTGAVVAGATVIVTNRDTNVAQRLSTSSSGTYTVRGLTPGNYDVQIEASGFQNSVKTGIPVQVSTIGSIDFNLVTGSASETVSVTADQQTLNTTQPQIGTTIDPEVLESLPVEVSGRGRQADALQFLSPGTTGSTFSHRISGGADFSQEILYNGIPVPQSETEGYTTNYNPPYDLVSEVRVERTTFSAQFGLGQGALTYQTKSGTNEYHGSLFEINRNNFFDSVGFYNSKPQGGNGQVPLDHENNYGFTVGGPLSIPKIYNARSRTFGLYSQEWFKQNAENQSLSTLPSVQEKAGNFGDFVNASGKLIPIYDPTTGAPFGCSSAAQYATNPACDTNIIPQSRFSPASVSFLQYLPNPDRPGTGTGNLQNNKNFVPNSIPNIQHVWGFVIDHKINDKQSLHYTQWRNTFNNSGFDNAPFVLAPNPLSSQRFFPNIGSVFLLSYSNALTDKLVVTAGVGWIGEINNQFNHLTGINSPVVQQSVIAPNINFGGGQGYTSWGTGGSNLSSVNRKLGLSFVNNWLWTKGRHTFNIGGEIRRTFQDDNEEQTAGGQFNFSSHQTSVNNPADANFGTYGNPFASFLLGLPDNALRSNSQELKLRNLDFSPYIQDDIKLSTRLTVNLGIRYDIQVPFTEVHDNVVYFNPNVRNPAAVGLNGQTLFGAVSRLGFNGEPSRASTHFGHFGPRFGLAYKLNDKTVVQGGFSIAFLNGGAYEYGTNKVAVNYGNLLVGSFVRGSTNSYTSSYGQWDNNPLPNPQATPYNPSLGNGQNINAFNPSADGFAPYSQQWSVNVQRQLPFRTFLTAAWVGNRIIHLPSALNPINQLNPQYLALQGKLSDTFTAGQTQVDGVNLPYTNFIKDFGGNATVAQALRPYPQFNNIQNNFEGSGTAYYQSLQVEVDKHLSNGLSFLIGYTLSRSMDNASSGFSSFANGGINKFNQTPEYSISSSDEPNTLKISGTYELPLGPGKPFFSNRGVTGQLTGGWKIGWILDYEQGTPFGVSNGSSPINGFNRPNRVPGVALKSGGYNLAHQYLVNGKTGTIPQIFNTAAFVSTGSQYILGNAMRNYAELRGPNYYNEAASLEKGFFLSERYKLTLKVDYFNLLNRTYFAGGINTDYSNSNVGQYSPGTNSTNRQGQATIRLNF